MLILSLIVLLLMEEIIFMAKKLQKKSIEEKSLRKTPGKRLKGARTPEQVVDEIVSSYFAEAGLGVVESPKDFSPQGARDMLSLQAILFLSRQLKEPDIEPPWFAQDLLKWAFPPESIKVSKTLKDDSGNTFIFRGFLTDSDVQRGKDGKIDYDADYVNGGKGKLKTVERG